MQGSDTDSNTPNQDRGRSLASYARAQVARAARCGHAGDTSAAPDAPTGYTLHREVHRGGQGTVFEGTQHSTSRRVAIKLMHEVGSTGARRQARFEQEIEILAQLRHPNIVTVHDGGTTPTGRYFLAMDFVDGEPIDDFLAGRELTVRETVALFLKICQAVNAAHLRGIVHRDLKPSNIRVDPAGEPHVLDFGLAKIVDGEARGARSAMTMTGEFLGTLHWTSPEQADGAQERVDVRSDVYGLGMLLFHGLTGRFPYDVIGHMSKVLASITHAEPARPSSLRPDIDDDVDTIVLKCLSKQPERRYQSAGELARDLQRYLDHQPIEAKRDSTLYVIQRLIRRNRVVVASIAAVLMSLLVGLVVAVVLLVQVRDERNRANAEARAALQTRNLLTDSFELADPTMGPANISAREVLDAAVRSLERASLESVPKAALLRSVGQAYLGLGDTDAAANLLHASLEILEPLQHVNPADYVESLLSLAELELITGRHSSATDYFETSLSILREHAISRPELIAKAKSGLGNRAMLGDDGKSAELLYAEACREFENLGLEYRTDFLECERDLAASRAGSGDEEAGILRQKEILEATRIEFGPEHPIVARALHSLATTLRQTNRIPEALELEQAASSIREKSLGDSHYETIESRHDLAYLLGSVGRYAEAEQIWRQLLPVYRKNYGDTFWTGVVLINLGRLLHRQGKNLEEAAQAFRDAITIAKTKDPERGPSELLERQAYLVTVLMDTNSLDEADEVSAELLGNARTMKRVEPVSLGLALVARGEVLARRGECHQAIPLLQEAIELDGREKLPSSRFSSAWTKNVLGGCFSDIGDLASAASFMAEDFNKVVSEWRASPQRRREAMERVIAFHERAGDFDSAAQWREKLASMPLPEKE